MSPKGYVVVWPAAKKNILVTLGLFSYLDTIPCISVMFNSTNYCTILILLLHIITYDLLLHVSTLIRHLQGALLCLAKITYIVDLDKMELLK